MTFNLVHLSMVHGIANSQLALPYNWVIVLENSKIIVNLLFWLDIMFQKMIYHWELSSSAAVLQGQMYLIHRPTRNLMFKVTQKQAL